MINIKSTLSIMILWPALIIGIIGLLSFPVQGQTYTSTLHGTSANRSAVEATFPYTTNGLCAHCHDQHASIAGAEPTLPSAQGPSYYSLFQDNYGSATNDLCYACHDTFTISGMTLEYGRYGIYQGSTKYNSSIHSTSASMDWSPDSSPPGPPFGPNSTLTDPGNCHNCHNPHGYDDGSGLVPHMLFARDSQTSDSPAYEMGCEACHDGSQGGAFKDVQAQLNKTYAHPTHTYNDRHTLPENGTSFETRHAECVDCHNPHTVLSGTHTAQTDGNAVSNALKYVWGVEPIWPSRWTKPVTFTERKPSTYNDGAQYEYQICFKCHSNYGLGTVTNGKSTITGPSGTIITDQAWEFNTNNRSAHPVVAGTNSYSGAMTSSQMSSPWTTSLGTQTMYCSDCHGANDEHSTGAKGPHGSSTAFMLKDATNGSNVYWPASSSGTLFSLNDVRDNQNNWSTQLFCVNCHPLRVGGNWVNDNEAHKEHERREYEPDGNTREDVYCVACHSAIPHGSRISKLIAYGYNGGYGVDTAPWVYTSGGVIYNVIKGFKVASGGPDDYDEKDCYSTANRCDEHDRDEGGYDN